MTLWFEQTRLKLKLLAVWDRVLEGVVLEDVIAEGEQHLKQKTKTQRDTSKNNRTYLNYIEVEPSSQTRVSSVKVLFSRSFWNKTQLIKDFFSYQ